MNATMAVMAREMMARRELLLLAVVLAIMISLLPFLPNIETYEATDVRTVGSSVTALALGCFLALLLGATVFGNDLSEGRLGFFFARPVSGFAVWWGRVSAVMVLVWIVEIIVLAPALYSEGIDIFTSSDVVDLLTILAYVIAPLLLFLLAHSLSILVRAGTPWLFLDLGGAIVFAVFAWLNLEPMFEIGAEIALWVIAGALIAALLLSLSVGGASGVALGRVDLKRAHGAQSLAMWSTMAICIAATTVYGSWLRDFGPRDITDVDVVSVAPNGEWAEVRGGAQGRLDVIRRFLISTTDGRWLAMTPFREAFAYRDVAYPVSASRAAWLADGGEDEPRTVWIADLDESPPRKRPTTLVVSPGAHLTFSPKGNRMAVVEGSTLSFYEVEDESLVTAVRLPGDLHDATVFFLSSDLARLYGVTEGEEQSEISIAEVDVSSGQFERTGGLVREERWYRTVFDSQLKHVFFRGWVGDPKGPTEEIFDARTGEFIRAVDNFKDFLADGRVVSFRKGDDTSWLVIESREGIAVELALGSWEDVVVCGEPSFGDLVVIRRDGRNLTGGPVVLDIDSGSRRSISDSELICRGTWLWKPGSLGALWYVGGPLADSLFMKDRTSLARWDPETGELIHVVGGRQ